VRAERTGVESLLEQVAGEPPQATARRLRDVDLERRAAELDARERELVRREEAAARWFGELARIERLHEQERRAGGP